MGGWLTNEVGGFTNYKSGGGSQNKFGRGFGHFLVCQVKVEVGGQGIEKTGWGGVKIRHPSPISWTWVGSYNQEAEGAIQTPNPPDNSSNVFRHGQWYIALSCFTWKINVFVKILDSEGQLRTTNQRIS